MSEQGLLVFNGEPVVFNGEPIGFNITIAEAGPSLLPMNATRIERSIEATTSRVGAVSVPITDLWNPDRCPLSLLPWLAWTLSVDNWNSDWSETTKREVLRQSVDVHRRKGTVGAVKKALKTSGFGDATLVERFGWQVYDGSIPRDGSRQRFPGDHWAEYRVILTRPITIEQAEEVREILRDIAPARAHLKGLDFTEANNIYNGRLVRDGTSTRGVA